MAGQDEWVGDDPGREPECLKGDVDALLSRLLAQPPVFRVADRVECLDDTDHAWFLRVGGTYVVEDEVENGYVVMCGMARAWEPERFRRVDHSCGWVVKPGQFPQKENRS